MPEVQGEGRAWGSRRCINRMAGQDGAGRPGRKGVCLCGGGDGGRGSAGNGGAGNGGAQHTRTLSLDWGGSGIAAGWVRFWGVEWSVPSCRWEWSVQCP